MPTEIQIIEKPDWISWEEIKKCLYDAHSVNRQKGINMRRYLWSAEDIRNYIGPNGVMLVALDGKKVIGTAAISEKYDNTWYIKGRYAYLCFGCVLPQYSGQGIFKKMEHKREEIALLQGYDVLLADTHIKNKVRLHIAKHNGYHKIHCFRGRNSDHYSVIIAKWAKGCPYPPIYLNIRFYYSWLYINVVTILRKIKRYFFTY